MDIVFFINVDWYLKLHWLWRVQELNELYNVHIVTNFTCHETKKLLISKGFVCHHIDLYRQGINPFKEIVNLYKFNKIVSSIEPSLIHSVTVKPNIIAGFISKYRKIPSVRCVTGLGTVFTKTSILKKLIRKIVLYSYRTGGHSHDNSIILFENNDDLTLFENHNISKNSHLKVISGAGIDLIEFSHTPEPSDEVLHVLFAARMIKTKGLEYVVEAVKNLRHDGYQVELNIAGIIDKDADESIPLEYILSLAKNNYINWLGNVSNMADLIGKNHIVVLPSFYREGIPRILIEAAAIGRPIITTDMPGCRETVNKGKNGFLVEPCCSISLYKALEKLIGNKLLRISMGNHSRKHAESKFCQHSVLSEFKNIYKLLLLPDN